MSFETLDFVQKNGLTPVGKAFFSIAGINNQIDTAEERDIYNIDLISGYSLQAAAVPHITVLKGVPDSAKIISKYGLEKDAVLCKDHEVDILVGTDHPKLMPRYLTELEENYTLNESVLTKKKLIHGGDKLIPQAIAGFKKQQVLHINAVRTDANSLFYKAESLGTEASRACKNCMRCPECAFSAMHMAKREHEELKLIESNLKFDSVTKRWSALYPKNEKINSLTDNYVDAYKRLCSLEKKLDKNMQLNEQFNQTFKDAVDRGLYRKITKKEANDYNGKKRYSPFVLVEKDSESTPLRLCGDSSSSSGGLSLNDCLVRGPPALNNLLHVLLRFRVGGAAVVVPICCC